MTNMPDDSRVSPPLRILILGGTGFIGPHFVREAVHRGHHVAVFNRGRHNANAPEGVERLVGDRNGDLSAIRHRDWDAVIDLSTYGPAWVRSLGEAVASRIGHYIFISSIGVYKRKSNGEDTFEGDETAPYLEDVDPYTVTTPNRFYGPLKLLCEQEAEQVFLGRTASLRPGYIVGPAEPIGAFTFWLARMELGGEMLVCGERDSPIQFIHVADLARWSIRVAERRNTGIFNVVGPERRSDLAELVDTAHALSGEQTQIVWVPSSWLAGQERRELWGQLLFWTSEKEGLAPTMRISNYRAIDRGLTLRSTAESLGDTFEFYRSVSPAERERLVTRSKQARIAWSDYLDREKQVIAEWRRQAAN